VESPSTESHIGQFDLIVSNPPYITSAVVETLEPEVKDFDPRLALDGGPDGLAPYRVIAAQAHAWLRPGGRVLVEIGYDQGHAVSALFTTAGFGQVRTIKDLNGLDRVVSAHHI
jgi:release factor glutamine methyltransferase